MIKQLQENDRGAAVALLQQSPVFNLYMLGNIAVIGFDRPFCQFWGDVDKAGTLRAVLNRYMNGWVIFGLPGADWAGLAVVLDDYPLPAERLQDNPVGIESWLPFLCRYRACQVDKTQLMALDAGDFRPVAPPAGVRVRRGVLADVPRLVDFFADAGDMARSPAGVERPLRDTRIWLAEQADGPSDAPRAILSTALTNAEVPDQAMIGGVYTPPPFRQQGLSRAVCSALCADLFGDKKQPVLYWENPAAGSVYTKLGFHPIGIWRSVRLEPIKK